MKKPEHTVRFLPVAEEDLTDIVLYVAADNTPAAERLAQRFETLFDSLRSHPHMGRTPDDAELARLQYRYLVIDDYLIFYVVDATEIVIHRVVHGARDYRRLL